ncbi:fluoride efflux transporter FluC [Pediococcus ethanolidurans]
MDELIIGVFAFIGGILRYELDQLIPSLGNFLIATFLINVLGSFLLALLTTTWSLNERVSQILTLGLGTGLIGAFTTFSSFSLEIFKLLVNHHYLLSFVYLTASILSGIIGGWMGIKFGEKIYPQKEDAK